MLQSYKNTSAVSIEAKYVFPLDDMAAGKCSIHVHVYPVIAID